MSMEELDAACAAVGGPKRLAYLVSRTERSLQVWRQQKRVPRRAAELIRRTIREKFTMPRSHDLPEWIVPPLRFCGAETKRLMSAAWRHDCLLVVKSSDGKRIGLSHFSRGVIHEAENTDAGKAALLALVTRRDRAAEEASDE